MVNKKAPSGCFFIAADIFAVIFTLRNYLLRIKATTQAAATTAKK